MFIKNLCLGVMGLVISCSSIAATPKSSASGANEYMFIDNNVDNEYFIASAKLDPRFSGANTWLRYKSNQVSLGYMGYVIWAYSKSYFDMWISNSPITQPFTGIRCMNSGATCPASGYIPAEIVDREGFYHTMSGNTVYNGSYGFASFSPAAYAYFLNVPVGSSETYELNLCYTNKDYDHTSGQRCKDLPDSEATWRIFNLTETKVSHLNLKSTGAMAEIWVASDGTPSLSSGSESCKIAIVNKKNGLTCKMIAYNLKETKSLNSTLKIELLLDSGLLGFTPKPTDVSYSGDGSTWNNYGSSVKFSNIFTISGDYVYIFMSNDFFKSALNAGTNITNKDGVFTFLFDNHIVSPESGYYQFTPSTKLNILPREYGISIVSTDGSTNPKASGKIGEDSPPIEFDYKVTTSAARQADSITAQVKGDSVTLGGVPYCLFKSPDDSLQVPIPAYLSWISSTGSEVKVRNSCSEAPIDMTDATWVQTAWNASVNDGFFFTTNLKLLFPMNDVRSKLSVNDEDWMGTVSASGTVEVTAKWIGVDK